MKPSDLKTPEDGLPLRLKFRRKNGAGAEIKVPKQGDMLEPSSGALATVLDAVNRYFGHPKDIGGPDLPKAPEPEPTKPARGRK